MILSQRATVIAVLLFLALGCLQQGAFPGAIVCLVLAALMGYRGRQSVSGTFGTARWASGAELKAAKLLGARGLILGRVGRQLLRVEDFCHLCTIARTGAGKGVAVVVVNLLAGWTRSCVILDPKGENYRLTAEYRRALGHLVVAFDPFLITEARQRGEAFGCNPMAFLSPDSEELLDACRQLAEALAVREKEERDPHWSDSAVLFLLAVMAWVIVHGNEGERNLQTVASLLASPETTAGIIADLCRSNDPYLRRLGGMLSRFEGKELGGVMTTVARNLGFLNSPLMDRHTARDPAFDPRLLRGDRPVTIYWIVPADKLKSHSRLLRLWLTFFLQRLVQDGPDESRRVLFLLDEVAQLGPMEILQDAVGLVRGWGIRLWFFYQSVGQIEATFPGERARDFIANMSVLQYFAINDWKTAEEISARLGDATVLNISRTEGTGTSMSEPSFGRENPGNSRSLNDGATIAETGRRLLKPEEILLRGDDEAIVFAPRCPPVMARLVRYYRDGALLRPPQPRRRLGWLFVLLMLLVAGVTLWLVAR